MTELDYFSTIAANNNAAPPDGWPENTMTFGQINNTAREMMASLARWYQDNNGSLSAGALTYYAPLNAYGYNITLNRSTWPHTIGYQFRFRPPQQNVGPTWLNVNNTGANWLVWPDGSMLRASDLQDVVTCRAQGDGRFVLENLQRKERAEFQPAASVHLLFANVSAPAGWIQNPGWNDRLIRVVSGTGLGAGGQWAIYGLGAESANHTHNVGVSWSGTTSGYSGSSQGTSASGGASTPINNHTHTYAGSGTFTTDGESVAHTHYGDGSWRPAYADMILCYKP